MAVPLFVLIPTHGRPTLLGRTLASLAACRLPAPYRETVVVENGTKAGAEAVVAEAARAHPHLRLRYLHVDWANKSHALNEALKTVDDGLVVFFDDDVRMDPKVLEAYAEVAVSFAGSGAYFGGPVGIDYEVTPPSWLHSHLPASARGYEVPRQDEPTYYLGFNWAAFASDLRAAGGFDPNVGPGSPTGARGQESDMQRRLRLLGIRFIDVEGARVWHYVPRDRCSVRWALARKYYAGKDVGQQARQQEGKSYVAFAMLAVLRLIASAGLGALKGDLERSSAAVFGLMKKVGSIRGFFHAPSIGAQS